MKMPHLWRVDRQPRDFAPLITACKVAGLRVGWLDWTPPQTLPQLEEAAASGAQRAVGVGAGRSVAIKLLQGEPVPRDVLREHFRGCHLVLIRGEVELPLLRPPGEEVGEGGLSDRARKSAWHLSSHDRQTLELDDLVREIRRPSTLRARDLGPSWQVSSG